MTIPEMVAVITYYAVSFRVSDASSPRHRRPRLPPRISPAKTTGPGEGERFTVGAAEVVSVMGGSWF